MKKLISLVLALCLVLSCGILGSAEEEYIQITWAQNGDAPKANAEALEALNVLLREKIGVELTIEYMSGEAMQLSMQSGEVYDIYYTCNWLNDVNENVSKGIFYGCTQEEIAEKAPGMYAAMSQEVWDLVTYADGKVYAFPNKKDYAAEQFMQYPKDIAEELGYEIPEVLESLSDVTDFLVAWKATMAEDEYPVAIPSGTGAGTGTFDSINGNAGIGCIFGTTEVIFWLDDPSVQDFYHTLYEWMQLGLISPDAAVETFDGLDRTIPAVQFNQCWDGYDGYTAAWGYNVGLARLTAPMLKMSSIQGAMNAFSATLANDEEKLDACFALFDLLHTDQLVADTLRFGVQGVHWYYVEDETSPCYGGVVQTQAGKDNYSPAGYCQPSYFFCSIAVSEAQLAGELSAPNFDQYDQYYTAVANEAQCSALGGFKWDSTGFESVLAELSAIQSEYSASIKSGTIDIMDVYDEYMERVYNAGLQDVIDSCQEQLDEYLANN